MLAASAIFYFSQRAKEARDDANNLADGVNELSAKFQTMSHIELSASIAKMSQSLPELSDAVAEAKKEFNDATYAVQFQQINFSSKRLTFSCCLNADGLVA